MEMFLFHNSIIWNNISVFISNLNVTVMLNRLEMLRIFCTAAESSSFKEAANRLGISPQAVTRAVKELEQLQGELLFHRNTRHIQVTLVLTFKNQ